MDKITARQAFDAGLTRYFTGDPCKFGHVAERMVSNGSCVECLRARRAKTRKSNYAATKAWRAANPGARAEEARRYREKHPDVVAAIQKRHREKNIEAIRERDRAAQRIRRADPVANKARLERFKQRKEEERVLLAGRPRPTECDICATSAIGPIVFDHCHVRGHFRGWLCDRCNKVLGLMKDDPALLRSLAQYLENDCGKADDESAEGSS